MSGPAGHDHRLRRPGRPGCRGARGGRPGAAGASPRAPSCSAVATGAAVAHAPPPGTTASSAPAVAAVSERPRPSSNERRELATSDARMAHRLLDEPVGERGGHQHEQRDRQQHRRTELAPHGDREHQRRPVPEVPGVRQPPERAHRPRDRAARARRPRGRRAVVPATMMRRRAEHGPQRLGARDTAGRRRRARPSRAAAAAPSQPAARRARTGRRASSRAPMASSPPSANSQARVGIPKNAHGCARAVSHSESANDTAPSTASATAREPATYAGRVGRADDARAARPRRTSSGHTT